MSRSKHSEAQMIAAVRQMEAGRKAEDVAVVRQNAIRSKLRLLLTVKDGKWGRSGSVFGLELGVH